MTRCLLTLIAILFATPAAAADEEFTYDPIGKRDPFRGLVDEPPPPTPHSVLSAWGLAELRLVAVADAEGGRYAMHGVLVEFKDGMMNLIATDGRRLALSGSPVDTGSAERPSAIVPTKGMNLFCRVINDPLEQVRFQFSENQIGMKTANAEIFARLIDGEFPAYSAVIPKKAKNAMEADAEVLGRKLRLVANVTGAEARAARLQLKKNELEISGQFAGRGEAHAHMEVDYKGNEAEIAFNPDFVVEGIKNCEKDTVRLEFEDKTSPGKFTLGENYIYIVMPITVDA